MGVPSVCCEYAYYHWLTKKLLWPMTWQNIARQERQIEYKQKEGRVEREICSCWRSRVEAMSLVVKYRIIELG